MGMMLTVGQSLGFLARNEILTPERLIIITLLAIPEINITVWYVRMQDNPIKGKSITQVRSVMNLSLPRLSKRDAVLKNLHIDEKKLHK